MTFFDLISARYSVRKYRPDPVPEDAIRRILEAGRLAPSAANRQPWHFFVVRDAAVRAALFPHERHGWIREAPAVLVACSVPGKAWVRRYDDKNHADVDLAIAMEHMVLAATAEGLGTCWVCAFDPQVVRQALKLPGGMEPVAATPLGYAGIPQGERDRLPLEEVATWIG